MFYGVADNLPKTDTLTLCRFSYFCYRCLSYTPCRVIYDTFYCLLVVRVCHNTEVSNYVLYLLSLVEAQSAVNPVWYSLLAHQLLKGAALRIGAIENGKVRPLTTVIPLYSFYVAAYNVRLLLVAIRHLQSQFLALVIAAIHFLVNLSFVVFYQAVGSLYNALCAAVVLLQFKQFRADKFLLEVQYVINVCTSKSVDTLCVIAHYTNPLMFRQLQHYALLDGIGILVLVNKNILELLSILATNILVVAEEHIS